MRSTTLATLALACGLLAPQISWAQCDDQDRDNDGCSCLQGDCDDSDENVRGRTCAGGAFADICDGLNNDCDDATADGSAEAWFAAGCDGSDVDLCSEGIWQCVAGSQVCSDPNDADPDLCNGLDDDCNPATADGSAETWLGQACDGSDADLCNEGVWECSGGNKSCTDPNDSDPDICNGQDDDCNPATADGSAEANFGQSCDGSDTDQCTDGQMICNGSSMVCDDDAASVSETCNGQDDDCDGDIDEDWPTLGNSCDGSDTDLCSNGTVVCTANHLGVDCQESLHRSDLCNGQDDDCNPATADGSAESWYLQPCDGADNDLCLEGTASCVGGHQQCSDNTGDIQDICNGLDDDCNPATADGSVDPQFGQACDGSDSDLCTDGQMICDGSTMVCNDDAASANETCNGQDDDCDGDIDEDWPTLGDSCDGTDADLCSNGTIVCRGDHTGTRCGESVHLVDLCNGGVDDDCNPATADGSGESWFGQACDGSDSDLCAEGTWFCQGSSQVCSDNSGDSIEVCDGLDNDCDGDVDEGFDVDNDGVTTCAGDCDDNDPLNFPGNQEVCDNQDNNCNGDIDEGFDVDGDGYFDCAYCAFGECDCDDDRNDVFPHAPEYCDNVDHDCDCNLANGFADADNDGVPACAPNECNDDPNNHGADQHGSWYRLRNCQVGSAVRTVRTLNALTERCDALDNDCDNHTDENLQRACYTGPAGTIGVGTCSGGQQICDATVAGVEHWSSCTGEVVPANDPADDETTCDNRDDDCDNSVDDGLVIDLDHDGVRACGTCNAPAAPNCDCNDGDDTILPGATETCDAIDRDCDGQNNNDVPDRICFEGNFVTPATYTGDCPGHDVSCQPRGSCVAGTQSCLAAGSWSSCGGSLVLPVNDPSLDETLCDQHDNDCDGQTDEGNFDLDNDGSRSCALCTFLSPEVCDCDDALVEVKPGGTEVCDSLDNDCNGEIDDDGAGGPLALACYTGQPPATQDVGLCAGGFNLCENGVFGSVCVGEVIPAGDDVCDGYDNNCDGEIDEGHDQDQDGVTTCGGDCNDADPEVFAGNIEICDGKDNDCDGNIDGVETACYSGPSGTLNVGLCHAGHSECLGGVPVGSCAEEVIPQSEICDGLDNDCDGQVDEDFDLDGDGYFDCLSCDFIATDQCDCDDQDSYNKPGAIEICDCSDNNCNNVVDEDGACEGGACHDLDADGYRNCDGDCNDRDSHVGPGFAEIWGNGIDDDCDGAVDEDVDEDGDGYSIGQGDCDDRFVEINPGRTEICDGFDNNCDGQVDEGFDQDGDFATVCAGDCDDQDILRSPLYREVCGDGIDNNCNGIIDEDGDVDGDGVSVCQGDCNDHNRQVHGASGSIEAAPEVCDGQDNDCDGRVDEDFDHDGDRWFSCLGDCDDENADVNPDRLEIADNGIDDDCDGQIDEGELDMDGDGFSPNCGDCNDDDSSINPHAAEACDRIDNNCDGYVDAMLGQFNLCATCFDADNDGFTNCQGDCNDSEPSVYPGAQEICDLLDNDCDHSVDLDPLGNSVCGDQDAGEDAGDALIEDANAVGADAGVVVSLDANQADVPQAPEGSLVQGCQCSSATQRPPVLLFVFGLLFLLWRRARRHASAPLALLVMVTFANQGCESQVQVPGVIEAFADASLVDSAGFDDLGQGLDAGPGRDAQLTDLSGIDRSTTGCAINGVIPQTEILVPATSTPFALPPDLHAQLLDGVDALSLDSGENELLGFILRRAMPEDVDIGDEHFVSDFVASQMPLLEGFESMRQPIERIEEHKRVFVDLWGRAGVVSTQRLVFAAPVTAYAAQQAILERLSQQAPGSMSGFPVVPSTAKVHTEIVVKVLFLLSDQGIIVVSALSGDSQYARNQIELSDLTNGSHLGVEGYSLRSECEPKTMPELHTDFLWVIDNSASMQEEQQALADATDQFYDALILSGLDFRLGVTTTDSDTLRGGGFTDDPATFAYNVQVGINGNGREMGLEFGLRSIETCQSSVDPARMLRDDAALLVIFVSDEDSTNLLSLDAYVDAYQQTGAVVYGIVGPLPWGCQRVGLGVARPGRSYIEVAERSGGATGSICNPNLAETITSILIGAAGAASRSPLARLPVSNSLAVRVERQGVFSPSLRSRDQGFDFEPGSNTVLFFGDATTLPPAGAQLEVAYQYFAPPEG